MLNVITIAFRTDTLFAIRREDGVFVAVKPICDALGLAWRSQWKRLRDDPILSEGITVTVMPSTGGPQETTLLRLDLVNGWLFTIDDSRVRDEETRRRVLTYKRECYGVLFRHFYGRDERAGSGEVIAPPQETEAPESYKLRQVTEARHTFGTQAASQLWFKLGLPVVPAMYYTFRQADLFVSRHLDAA